MSTLAHDLRGAPSVPATTPSGPTDCYTSVTLWRHEDFYLEIHYGYFNSIEAVEEFTCSDSLHLIERGGAVFIGARGLAPAFVPDGALQVFSGTDPKVPKLRAALMTVDDLLIFVRLEDMQCIAIGHDSVARGVPIQIRAQSTEPAANDE